MKSHCNPNRWIVQLSYKYFSICVTDHTILLLSRDTTCNFLKYWLLRYLTRLEEIYEHRVGQWKLISSSWAVSYPLRGATVGDIADYRQISWRHRKRQGRQWTLQNAGQETDEIRLRFVQISSIQYSLTMLDKLSIIPVSNPTKYEPVPIFCYRSPYIRFNSITVFLKWPKWISPQGPLRECILLYGEVRNDCRNR